MTSEGYFNQVAVLGLGLIGGSVAYALHEKYPDIKITAYDPAADAIPEFIMCADSARDAVKGAELIMLASPPGVFSSLAKVIAPHLEKTAIITDVGSVKLQAIKAIQPELPAYVNYIPGHPIAGKAEAGFAAAEAGLFKGKKVILTPQSDKVSAQALQSVKHMWQQLGANVETMSPATHDLVYAYVSHLPQMVAFAMMPLLAGRTVNDELYKRFTRLAGSDKKLWADIASANATNLAQAIAAFTLNLQSVMENRKEQTSADPVALAKVIGRCLYKTVSALQVDNLDPAAYAGTGFKDMTVYLPGPDEEIVSGSECRQLAEKMNAIKYALHSREELAAIL